jgi:cell division septum initiation protein DivIVA
MTTSTDNHPETMTKAEEIQAWRKFSATMPPASTYSGRWIAEQIDHIAADIADDLEPGTLHAATVADCRARWRQAQEDADATHAAATAAAERTKARAQDEAAEIVKRAHAAADLIRGRALAAIREATRTLEA